MPELSIPIITYSEEDPVSFRPLLDQVRAADAAGIDRIVCPDHVVFGEHLHSYGDPRRGGIAGGQQPTSADGIWLEPLTFLAAVGAVTDRVRLGTSILLAALRRPVVLAKVAATIDVLTGGRLDIGVGVGWQREEYDAAGLDFDARGRLLDQTIEVCQVLWRDPIAAYDAPGLRFDRIHQMPKPRQAGGVPIWVSGTVNRSSARRLARFGSGWIPWGPAADDLAEAIPAMVALVTAEGGDPDFGVVGTVRPVRDEEGSVDLVATFRGARPLVEAGVTDVRVGGLRTTGSYDDDLVMYQAAVKAFRDALH